jgi:hypothetical protein
MEFADLVVDVLYANGIGVSHRPAAPRRKAIAVQVNNIDVGRAQREAFREILRSLVDERVNAASGDFRCADIASCDARFVGGLFNQRGDCRIGQRVAYNCSTNAARRSNTAR